MPHTVTLDPGLRLLYRDLGISETDVLRRVGLPADLLSRDRPSVSTDDYFALWDATVELSGDPMLPLRIGTSITPEMFSPPLFAAMCSPDANIALQRLSTFKRLCGPFVLDVEVGPAATRIAYHCSERPEMPAEIGQMELVFITHFVRMATRSEVRPVEVSMRVLPEQIDAYRDFFGVPVAAGDDFAVAFAELDARRPFLTGNVGMWNFFEPELRRRLAELDQEATVADRVHGALLELLPTGRAAVGDVAKTLGMSGRTLQRRLSAEGTRYQDVLNDTREQLARHYLGSTSMPAAEISFLLGYEDPNSFYRAFHQWTGTTPERVRGVG